MFGRAGGSLADSSSAQWAVNADVAKIGARGEIRTGMILDKIALLPGGPTVLHDVSIPGSAANIDHLVISGNRILLVDSKVWRGGFYWTLGRTRRGSEVFPPADKRTLPMAQDRLATFLSGRHVVSDFATPLLVVWPSVDQHPIQLWAMRAPGAKALPGVTFERSASRFMGRRPAHPALVSALLPLVK